MNSRSGRSQTIRHNYGKIYLLTALLCAVVAVAVGLTALRFIKAPASPGTTGGETGTPTSAPSTEQPSTEQPSTGTETPTETPTPQHQIENIVCTSDDVIAANPLLPVSADLPFSGSRKNIASVYSTRTTVDGVKLEVSGVGVSAQKELIAALEELNFRLAARFPDFRLLITSGLPVEASELGCSDGVIAESEHATGYAADGRFMRVSDKAGIQFTDGVGMEAAEFLFSEGAKLGIIQSKANVPGRTNGDLRHMRYVGVPHAQYIYDNRIPPADYLELLRGYSFNKRMTQTDAEGNVYEIYFVAASGSGSTNVPVPSGSDYTICGNGTDGFIVTLKIALAPAEPAAE